jgi:DNA-binding FadR family transcriptional regulator
MEIALSMSTTLPRRKIRDQAVDQIKELIRTQNLRPGDRLPTETELAEKFGISRLSVREATKALEFLGIIQAKTGVGLTVGQMEMARVTEHLGFHPTLQRADPQQLIDTRIIIETGVLPHVVLRINSDPSIATRLQTLVDRFRTARTLQAWIDLDIEFHRTLLESSGLEPLVAFGDLLHVFFQRFRESVNKAEWKIGIESHQRLVDLLRAGDAQQAADELRAHIESHTHRLKR